MTTLYDKEYPTCPHCGDENTATYFEVEDGVHECGKCGKSYRLESRDVRLFTTAPYYTEQNPPSVAALEGKCLRS